MTTIQFYSGLKNEYQSFSNFYNSPFQVKIKEKLTTFPTVEHYFHYQKALLFDDKEAQQAILNATDPLEVKRIGRTVKNFNPRTMGICCSKTYCKRHVLKIHSKSNS